MTTEQRKYGSFRVTVQMAEGQTEKHFVSPLSQNQIGEGWRQVLPKPYSYTVQYKDDDGKQVRKERTNRAYFKINMAELPPHLFSKMSPVYKQGNLSHYKVTERCYTYLVQLSPVDREIRELQHFVNNYNSDSYYEKKYLNYYRDLLTRVKENDISGWVVFKSQNILSH